MSSPSDETAQDVQKRRRAARARQERFFKRRRSFMKKAHELFEKCDAEVYVLIKRGNNHYTYKSSAHGGWPPAPKDVDMSYPIPHYMTPADFQREKPAVEPGREQPIDKEDKEDA